ncbi:putative sister chromatid separation protein (Src1) [Aspergillus candidus]|uniref:Sister chromatid separation protein n=1 Tax=Aspergillus candidus TaxID=41067 RepID=A0A2I2FG20_ASPCN|nr:sister chromatid separation protein [Aspergillus candidus]PLB39572.1 sister chromatid separation protein [Aspergillus candidus]
MEDAYDYLAVDFDLNSLTVPRLRSILVNHDVPYPASAKKAQLIRILEDEVLPQAKKLLRERERVKRTSEGITDMPSRATSVASEFDAPPARARSVRDSQPPPTPSTVGRRGRSRVSTRQSTVETDDRQTPVAPATPATTSRKTAPKSESKRYDLSDLQDYHEVPVTPREPRTASPRKSTARKLRRSEMAPSTEPEPPVSAIKAEPLEDGHFSTDNPFQSGSPARDPTRDQKRRSSSRRSTQSPALSQGPRARRSETPVFPAPNDSGRASARASLASPVSKWTSPKLSQPIEEEDEVNDEVEDEEEEESGLSAGEEFTPDEQLALEREQADRLYPRRIQTRRPRKQGPVSKAAPWVVILMLFGGFAAWWRQEKIEIGFCGIGKPTWSLAETKVPEWASVLEPQCEPCPPHAFCYPDFEARCEHDFILKPHPLSLGGLVPLPPTCEPDSEKARRVKAVADKAVEKLRDRRAKYECGELSEGDKAAKGPEITEPDLKQEVGQKRRKGMSDAEFDDLWKGALGEIVGKEEVVTKSEPSSVLILTSTSVSRLPLTCAFRRYVRLSILAYRLPLSILALCIGLATYARSRYLARRSDLGRVPELVATTLDRLATQAALHARGEAREAYIPIGQLRDDVLRSELQGSRREGLWRRVRGVVEGNANVRAAVREGRGGDVARVWEWIGGIGGVDVDRSASRQRQGSLSHLSPASSTRDHHLPPDDTAVQRMEMPRKWDEGRPIY